MILRFRVFFTTMLILLVGALPLEALSITTAKCHTSMNNPHEVSEHTTQTENNSLTSSCQHCDTCIVGSTVGLIAHSTTHHKITSFYSQFALANFRFKSFVLDIPHPPPQAV